MLTEKVIVWLGRALCSLPLRGVDDEQETLEVLNFQAFESRIRSLSQRATNQA